MESYIQYASGYQKESVTKNDIEKALNDIKIMDDEHGAFWVSVINEEENVLEISKDLIAVGIFETNPEEEIRYQARDWQEVKELLFLLVAGEFRKLQERIMKN